MSSHEDPSDHVRSGRQERIALRLFECGVRLPKGEDPAPAWNRTTHNVRQFYREIAQAAIRSIDGETLERARAEIANATAEVNRIRALPPPPPPTPTLVTHEGAGRGATSPHPGTPEAYAACPVCRRG